MENIGKKSILASVSLFILLIGILVVSNLVKSPQTIKSRASENLSASIEMISPKAGSKILGVTRIGAQVTTKIDPKSLSGVAKVGDISQNLIAERINDEKVLLSGSFDSTKFPPGKYNMIIILYNISTGSPALISSTQIPVTIVAP